MKNKDTNPIDKYVGSRVRVRRIMIGLTQENIGDACGITFQQIQKYEKGTNRIGASRLQQIANILQTDVAFFFQGAPTEASSKFDGPVGDPTPDFVSDFMATREGIAIARAFKDMPSPVRRSFVALVEQFAEGRAS